jgi:hypothetical protein
MTDEEALVILDDLDVGLGPIVGGPFRDWITELIAERDRVHLVIDSTVEAVQQALTRAEGIEPMECALLLQRMLRKLGDAR